MSTRSYVTRLQIGLVFKLIPKIAIYFVGAIVAIMPIVCVLSGLRYPNDDKLYPFWSHVLFAAMPFENVSYTLKIYALDNQSFPDGIVDYDIRSEIKCGQNNAFKLIFAMGAAKFNQQENQFLEIQNIFHNACFEKKRVYVKYSLHRNIWNVLDYWKNRRTLSEVELGYFEFVAN